MDDLPTLEFATADVLRGWLELNHATSTGVWLRIFRKASGMASVSFQDVLEAGLSYGWSESQRRAFDSLSYLQCFTPRRTRGTASERNRRLAEKLSAEGRMTPAGRAALGLDP